LATSLNFVDDIDGDGLDDFGIGCSSYSVTGIFLYLSSFYGQYLGVETIGEGHSIHIEGDDLDFISYGGDLDQDGLADVLTNGEYIQNFLSYRALKLHLGQNLLPMMGGSVSSDAADLVFLALDKGFVTDIDDDGISDYVLYSRFHNDYSGQNAIFLGAGLLNGPDLLTMSDADWVMYGQTSRYFLDITDSGDFNGDGKADLLVKEAYNTMGCHLFLNETILNGPTSMSKSDADLRILGGEPKHYNFCTNAGDLDADGLDDLVMNWEGELNGVSNSNYASVFFGSSLVAAIEAAELDDTGILHNEPVTLDVRDADFIFPDVTYARNIGDIDQDGLDELMLGNPSMSYAALNGGVNGIFSACEK
ncbi:MAG: hypothetical protein VX026_13650, partial [Myxococcota bacterium]|nr:hypothetical protein [Myxococcota bacterium]